jgi:protein required for attachment to host cells
MNRDCVVVADGSRARFFTLRAAEHPELESSPTLIEVNDLIQPEKEQHHEERWAESRPSRSRGRHGGPAHGFDDHREQHLEEQDRRFARNVAEEAARLARDHQPRNLILVAHKRMLGMLRTCLDPLMKTGVEVRELAKDLSKLDPLELHEHLAREQLIPRRRMPVGG